MGGITEAQYGLFLSAGTFICALGALLNLALYRKRGVSSLLLSAAFLTMGGLLWMIKSKAEQGYVTGAAVLLALFLIGDLVLRSSQQQGPR